MRIELREALIFFEAGSVFAKSGEPIATRHESDKAKNFLIMLS
jgi:hypothetical protein